MKIFVFILLFLELVLVGCRAKMESKARTSRTSTDQIGVELHRVDSLWSALAERLNYKIEFYPTIEGPRMPNPAAPCSTMPASDLARTSKPGGVAGGMGAVKSIEFSGERVAAESSFARTDSTADYKSAEAMESQTEKSSEARQDNGTVATVAIVFAVAALIYLLIKNFMKR